MKHLYPAGREGRKPADLFASLIGSGVELLIDVRDVPISRKPGFSKAALSQGLAMPAARHPNTDRAR